MPYKNKNTHEVISESCYMKMPFAVRSAYYFVSDTPTHRVDPIGGDNDDFALSVLTQVVSESIVDSIEDNIDTGSNISFDDTPVLSPDVSGGGGDFGGGGAGGDWD